MKTNKIRLNGKTVTIEGSATLGDLIQKKGLDPGTVVVEHNRAIIDTSELDRITPAPNDVIEILRFVGGG